MSQKRTVLNGLNRILAQENSASDLLSMLIELDPDPLIDELGLESGRSYSPKREMRIGRGRLDLVIWDDQSDTPAVVIELKGASSIHGNQLNRYLEWSRSFDHPPQLIFCAFDSEEAEENPPWVPMRLRKMFELWVNSNDSHARWLAVTAAELLGLWSQEADELPVDRVSYYAPDITSKRIARSLDSRIGNQFGVGAEVGAYRDNAGSPMVVAWVPFATPEAGPAVWLGVDLRSSTRRSKSPIWKFRPFVEVEAGEEGEPGLSQKLAFDIATSLREAMGGAAIRQMLDDEGYSKLAHALSRSKHDGFKTDPESFDYSAHADAITDAIAADEKYPGAGPFGQDWGRRLSTIHTLDTSNVDRSDVEQLIVSVLIHLQTASTAVDGERED